MKTHPYSFVSGTLTRFAAIAFSLLAAGSARAVEDGFAPIVSSALTGDFDTAGASTLQSGTTLAGVMLGALLALRRARAVARAACVLAAIAMTGASGLAQDPLPDPPADPDPASATEPVAADDPVPVARLARP